MHGGANTCQTLICQTIFSSGKVSLRFSQPWETIKISEAACTSCISPASLVSYSCICLRSWNFSSSLAVAAIRFVTLYIKSTEHFFSLRHCWGGSRATAVKVFLPRSMWNFATSCLTHLDFNEIYWGIWETFHFGFIKKLCTRKQVFYDGGEREGNKVTCHLSAVLCPHSQSQATIKLSLLRITRARKKSSRSRAGGRLLKIFIIYGRRCNQEKLLCSSWKALDGILIIPFVCDFGCSNGIPSRLARNISLAE